ncbi:MAG: hypothetical protein H7831_15045, partial [Magnetococcus sp. WYHC-3]
ASQAAVALDNLNLLEAQKKLFDSVIQIIAGAIDAKSPYTGGHCERVPEIGRLLAEAACAETDGPFADFSLDTDGWREFHLASWLHDCGKVTVPEYVVDKATKLETLYNRIHEVRTRFEVLYRDAVIAQLSRQLAGEPAAPDALESELSRLRQDFAFIAECNVGGEFMSPDKIARMESLAKTPWVRHFDDRLGLSQGELMRLGALPPDPLPAQETLLADKPHHIVPRLEHPLSYDPETWGFKVKVPDALYNNGEVYNLRIPRGTLTEEERYKINEHVINTIIMLDRLPFPKGLDRVGLFAGSHHETMVGSGYPRQLQRDDLPVQARIMALADVFEALTASDRPYKKAKTLSEAIRILSFMVKDKHIDADVFKLFLRSGAYRTYADKYLKPEQIDAVKVETYLS